MTQTDFYTALQSSHEMVITVTGRSSGRSFSYPVWFALAGDRLYLIPLRGSETQWYKNVLKNPSVRIKAGGAVADLNVIPVTDPAQLSYIIEKFRTKYGNSGVGLYSKLNVAVAAQAA